MKEAKTFTVFDASTRRPVSHITCDADQLSAQIREGQIAVEGRFAWSCRLDESGVPVDDETEKQRAQADRKRQSLMARIEELERKQHRRVRELLEADDPQLSRLSAEIAPLRAELAQLDGSI